MTRTLIPVDKHEPENFEEPAEIEVYRKNRLIGLSIKNQFATIDIPLTSMEAKELAYRLLEIVIPPGTASF